MKCRELADFLMDYVSGELPQESRTHFEFHLSKCKNCHEYLVQYEVTIKAGKIACDEMSDEMGAIPDDLVRILRPLKTEWLAKLEEQGQKELTAIRAAREAGVITI